MAARDSEPPVVVPTHLQKITFSSILPNVDLSQKYIQGRIVKCWPLVNSKKAEALRKFVLQEGGAASNAEVTVFFIGPFASTHEDLKIGDVVALSNVYVENSPGTSTNQDAGTHVILDKSRSDAAVWVISRSKANTVLVQNSPNFKGKKVRTYSYSPLGELKVDTVVNVYGVVKFFKLPKKTKGADYSMVISIVDPTLDINTKITCVLFAGINDLPMIEKNGDIVRFHRLKVNLYNGNLQGTNGPGFSWVIFRKLDPESPHNVNNPITNTSYTFTEEDGERVQELSIWAQSEQFLQLHTKVCTFSKVELGGYYDITCQVVGKAVFEQGRAILLQVWDGTQVTSPVYQTDLSEVDLIRDESLHRRAGQHLIDIFVFDDHYPQALAVQLGAFVTFYNLHAAKFKDPENGEESVAVQKIEFDLHGGTSYGRGLKVVSNDSPSVKKVLELINKIQVNDKDTETPSPASKRRRLCAEAETSTNVRPSTEAQPSPKIRPSTLGDVTHDQQQSVSSSSSDTIINNSYDITEEDILNSQSDMSRCMLVTATVITDHHHIKRTPLAEVNNATVPNKHRICAQIMDYQPRTNKPELFFKMHCSTCKFLSQLPKNCIKFDSNNGNSQKSDSEISMTLSQNDDFNQKWECLFLRCEGKRRINCRKLVEVDGERIADGIIVVHDDISPKELSYLQKKGYNIKLSSEEDTFWHETALPLYERGGIPFYACPKCQAQHAHDEEGEQDVPLLDYVYTLRFLLDDNQDWLIVNLWGDQAEKFFNGVQAKDAVQDKDIFHDIISQLNNICPERFKRETSSWLECCIQAHHTTQGTSYLMFDTQLASVD